LAAAIVAAGGEVWFGDETTLREFPPLRAAWARRGQQQVVVLSGRNTRRVVHGALNAATGDLVTLIRERSRQDDCLAFVQALGQVRPQVPKLLIWDNAPPHHPKRTSIYWKTILLCKTQKSTNKVVWGHMHPLTRAEAPLSAFHHVRQRSISMDVCGPRHRYVPDQK